MTLKPNRLFKRQKQQKIPVSLEGQTLGKYRVLEPLGRGGMARVYRAYHPQLDRYVALKVLRADLVGDEAFQARFQREARAAAALRHANIVQVFDHDVQDDVYYIVLELLEGDSLKTRLHDYRVRGEAMPLGEVVRVLLDVLDGLAYAHSEGMVHRDIKPGNILLTKRGEAVIADFGIAQIVGDTQHTAPGALLGTLNYIAPEQGMRSQSDARSDIYSLGVVLYEMLTQRPPFEADTPLAVLMKHAHDPLPLPREINPDIPVPFERIVLKALAKDPDDRYQSAAAMAQALREAAQRAEVDLPQRISLPLSFTTDDAPSESVAIFSGTAREKIKDAEFAENDTAATLTSGPMSISDIMESLQEGRALFKRGQAALLGVGLMAFVNMVGFTVAALTGWWDIFVKGWPMELFLAAAGLCAMMNASGSPWMLIPIGILLGNGGIFLYCSFTDNWHHWIFLWVFEIWTVVGAVAAAIWLNRQKGRTRRLGRSIALVTGAAALALSLVTGYLSVFFAVVNAFLGWFK
jgi:serine/threonine-protein kinase